MSPLSNDEAALLYHVQRWGSDGYPIAKVGRGWQVRDWRSVKGPPVVYKSKRLAVAQFEAWIALALDRWQAMKVERPSAILTAEGIR